jgi:hypothetical protein
MMSKRLQLNKGPELLHDTLQNLSHAGLSFAINDTQLLVPAIGAINAMVERHLRSKVATNTYVSFRRDSAFRVHWDDHDVLVLQAHGRKRWFCYGQKHRYPVPCEAFSEHIDPGEPEWEAVLEPGDVLYIPRGDYHRAQVEEGHSVHLTLQLVTPRGDDLIRQMAEHCIQDEIFRRDISALASHETLKAQESELRSALHRLVDSLSLEKFLANKELERAPYSPLNLGLTDRINNHMWAKPALRRHSTQLSSGMNQFTAGRVKATLTQYEATILEMLMQRDALTVGDIGKALPNLAQEQLYEGVASLARKSLIFLFESELQ